MMKTVFLAACLISFATFAQAQETAQEKHDPAYDAGYKWAEEQDIQGPEQCVSNSKQFVDGCKSWALDEDATNVDEQDSADERED